MIRVIQTPVFTVAHALRITVAHAGLTDYNTHAFKLDDTCPHISARHNTIDIAITLIDHAVSNNKPEEKVEESMFLLSIAIRSARYYCRTTTIDPPPKDHLLQD